MISEERHQARLEELLAGRETRKTERDRQLATELEWRTRFEASLPPPGEDSPGSSSWGESTVLQVRETDAMVLVRYPDGREVDVTPEVRAVYGLLCHSMDYSSGFLSIEDVVLMTRLALAAGYVVPAEAQQQMETYMRQIDRCPTCGEKVSFFRARTSDDPSPREFCENVYKDHVFEKGWIAEEVTREKRVIRANQCGHRFELSTPPGDMASLRPIP